MLIAVTLSGSFNYLRAVTIHQHSLKKLAAGIRHMPEFGPPSPNWRATLLYFLEMLFPLHQTISGLLFYVATNYCRIIDCNIGHSFVLRLPEYQQLFLLLLSTWTKETNWFFFQTVFWHKTQAWAKMLLHLVWLDRIYLPLAVTISRGRGRRFSNGCLLFVLWSKLPFSQKEKLGSCEIYRTMNLNVAF